MELPIRFSPSDEDFSYLILSDKTGQRGLVGFEPIEDFSVNAPHSSEAAGQGQCQQVKWTAETAGELSIFEAGYSCFCIPAYWIACWPLKDYETAVKESPSSSPDNFARLQPIEAAEKLSRLEQMEGVLLGTAAGDALGLPAEGLSPRRIAQRWRGDWRMRLFFGWGMMSDDTEHTVMVAQALLASPSDLAGFQRRLAWKLRWWLLGLPAGVGMATAKACIKLWLGVPSERSGVWSAGNGPAMRSAIIGVFFANDLERRRAFVAASTKMTHTDPRAEIAAQAVAEASALIALGRHEEILSMLPCVGDNEEWRALCHKLADAYSEGLSVIDFANTLGLARGVTGYAFHTVPVAIYAVLRHPDCFRTALIAALDCGGDADTVGAIVGAMMGARVGSIGIPAEWIDRIAEWPRSMATLKTIARELSAPVGTGKPVRYFWPGILLRNLFFLAVVLGHGFRRLLPPY